MKVLFINSVYKRGSTGRIVEELAKAVEKNGGEYKVAYGRGGKIQDEHCYKIGNKLSVYAHAFLSRITDKSGFYSKKATKKLVQFIRDYNPDVIHLHNLHGYYLNIEILFKFLKEEYKGKVLWTLHDCWAFTGHCTYFVETHCDKWKVCCNKCSQITSYPKAFIGRAKNNFIDKKRIFLDVPNLTIITVSNWLKNAVEQSFLGAYPIMCVYNGIDCEKFCTTESDIKEQYNLTDKKIILLVSDGWDERKGFDKFLKVAQIAPQDWIFVIVGVDKKQIKLLPSNAMGFERINNQQELIKWYSSADVFFNPSTSETFGLVTCEAMACGTPAVVVNSTACPELIKQDGCGVVIEPHADEQENIEAIMSAMNCMAPRDNVINNFTLEKNIKEYLSLYLGEANI